MRLPKLPGWLYDLVLDVIACVAFVATYCYLLITRPRPAMAGVTFTDIRDFPDFTPIATPDAERVYALMHDADDAAGDGGSEADGDGIHKVYHQPRRVPVRVSGSLGRLAQPRAIRHIPRYCMECLQEARVQFPNLEAVGLPLRCLRHRVKFDEWVRFGDGIGCLHRHRIGRILRDRLN